MTRPFDLDLVYVECSECGEPVLWDYGRTAEVVAWAGIDPLTVDETCMILSEGCPNCTPKDDYYVTHVVRLRYEHPDGRFEGVSLSV